MNPHVYMLSYMYACMYVCMCVYYNYTIIIALCTLAMHINFTYRISSVCLHCAGIIVDCLGNIARQNTCI